MNKHYKDAILMAAVEELQDAGYEVESKDLEYLVDTENCEEDWGDFDEDVNFLVEGWLEDNDEVLSEKDEPSVEEKINETCDSLKKGFNFIPGIGAGYARDEEDLAKMKEFVRGSLTMAAMMRTIFG